MNGTAPDVQIVRPFSEALEVTRRILFRPFDLKKWFIIGFAALLAHLGSGGFPSNYGGSYRSDLRDNPAFRELSNTIHNTPVGLIVFAAAFIILAILCLAVLFAWLRARGSFIFADCVVRNRAAIAEPWYEFRNLGNSFFVMSLLVGLGLLFFSVVFALPVGLMIVRNRISDYHDVFFIGALIIWACLIFVLAITWRLIAHLMIPIMYRRRCLAPEAFRAAISLISAYPGEIALYCFFWIVLVVGTVIVIFLVTCLTCCIAAIPYIGTVILLPIFVCLRAFGLLFLRQFGPDYDVWAALPPPDLARPEPPPLPAV